MRGKSSSGRSATGVVAALALLSVVGGVAIPAPPAGATSRPGPPTGVWRTDGYGTVLAAEEGVLREYQTTAVGCLEGAPARRTGGDAGSARYADDDGDVFTLRSTDSRDRASMRVDGSVGERTLFRIAALPDSCAREQATGPVATFDVFWATFEENYPFFAAKGIDWSAVRERLRPMVHENTTDAELFAVLSEMVRPLYDAHVVVLGGPAGVFAQSRPGTAVPGPELDNRTKEYVERRDLGGRQLQEFAGGRIGYADLPGGQGYVRVSGFSGYTEEDTYATDSAELDRALDAILTRERTTGLTGLIIDLRVNGGGSDALGPRIAARLTDRPYFAYAKRARNDPADPTRFTRPEPLYVQPARAPRFTGPVAVLTAGTTYSAGETFTQALIDRPGRTVRIGEPTQGVFSDILRRELPNGWSFWLPNEEFLTRSGETFDGAGIPAHLPEPVFTEEEFAHRRDSAFDRATEVLPTRS
ncbi:S41 family peptidase [Streptomyces sp. 35G-GA-8]|uniref:S41 family peptidase n=1 Tax=Streptomyces sp. 35G-GA-8 TaxID=2939434 RepID=UPI00201ECDEB|nr:S41 family peptidase [Streptomyces sp. 35G-GA-8]MCL7377852.1 S41 family peptidase [Streptomyces sp. 35G-GA-8]